MSNAYASLTALKSSGVLNLTGTAEDSRLRTLLESVSRQVDAYAMRQFFSQKDTRFFSGNGALVFYPSWDLIAVETLKEDENADGTFNDTWATTDYELWPYDANPTSDSDLARPYISLQINTKSNGTKGVWQPNQKAFELAGRFGYSERKSFATTLSTDGSAISASATSIVVAAGANLEILQTIKIENEQMYITNISTNTLTVERGVNGTTGATHDNSTDVHTIEYPGPIVEGTLMQAARLWTRRSSGFANQVGFSDTGQMSPVAGLDQDVRQMLRPYIRKVGVA